MSLFQRIVSLFQRIKTPFTESGGDDTVGPRPRLRAVGEVLRERREELGLDLVTIGEVLRIKPAYLAALEQGRSRDLPGPTYAIGFVRAYAHHLGLDSDRVLDRYKTESADVHIRPDLSLPVLLGERSLPGGPIVLVALILAVCGYGTWYYLSTGERIRPERVAAVPVGLQPMPGSAPPAAGAPAAGAPAASPALPPEAAGSASASASPLASPAAAAPTLPAPLPAPPAAPAPAGGGGAGPAGHVEIRALADCWIQVRAADQSIVFSRVLKAGETYQVPARPGLFLRTGNAGALAIAVDGKPAPSIGGIGTLRRNVVLDADALTGGTAVHG